LDFLLDPGVTFLNHGSYGACPAPVFEQYQELQRELERNPVEFLARRFDALTAESRAALAVYLGARPDDLVFVPNATAGLNAIAATIPRPAVHTPVRTLIASSTVLCAFLLCAC